MGLMIHKYLLYLLFSAESGGILNLIDTFWTGGCTCKLNLNKKRSENPFIVFKKLYIARMKY